MKPLRENHRVAYYALAGTAWTLLGFILFIDLLLLLSPINPWFHAEIIISGSMEPTIRTGSMVIMAPRGEYHTGDVVTFIDPIIGRNTHRIVGEVERDGAAYFVTQGDAIEAPDRMLVPTDRVEGKIEMIFTHLGYFAYTGFAAILIPLSLIVLHFIRKKHPGLSTGG